MRRATGPTIFILLAYLFSSAAGLSPPTLEPVTPPGPVQPITPPGPAPTPAPTDDPTPDDLVEGLEIEATIGGRVIGDDVVELPVGKLLTLRPIGSAAEPLEGGERPAVAWALSKATEDISIFPADGQHVTFSSAEPGPYLFVAAANNGGGAPFVALRWVTVEGLGPRPPPTPPQPDDDPVEPDDVAKVDRLYFVAIDRFADRTPQLAALLTDVALWDKQRAAGHEFDSFDADQAAARPFARWATALPVLIVQDAATGVVLHAGPPPTDAAGVEQLVAKYAKAKK